MGSKEGKEIAGEICIKPENSGRRVGSRGDPHPAENVLAEARHGRDEFEIFLAYPS